jgi:hypothetical protein
MTDERTCGRGLAEHSRLPATVAKLLAAMVDTLEAHEAAIDATDENGRRELEAYKTLSSVFHSIAAQLESTAARMASYRDLAMAKHDMTKMAAPAMARSFERFVALEDELSTLLRTSLERDRAMLSMMKGARA